MDGIIQSSFRDPSGFIFKRDGVFYRQVNISYRDNYDLMMSSGLYDALVKSGLLIPHAEVAIEPEQPENAYKILKPKPIEFVSYPYEWCFSQLKDAALTTLNIHKKSLEFGLSLKDCSAYNIQFAGGKPVFIDTLSFEKYNEGEPWVAYQQFCKHFLAPLGLMSYTDIRLNQLFRIYIDGVPLDLAARLLPYSTKFKFSLLTHIHLHAKAQQKYSDAAFKTKGRKISRQAFLGLIDSLETSIRKLTWNPGGTEWGDYYENTNYNEESFNEKKNAVASLIERIKPKAVWDLGANTGVFSRISAKKEIPTISFDIDPAAVEKNYLDCIKNNETNICPVVLDLTNPSPGLGWHHNERMSLIERSPKDTVMALALIHHLAISNNLPFAKIASLLNDICRHLIIEFVPKEDSQVKRLLATREDIFPNYNQESFERTFSGYFTIIDKVHIKQSGRILYLMENHKN